MTSGFAKALAAFANMVLTSGRATKRSAATYASQLRGLAAASANLIRGILPDASFGNVLDLGVKSYLSQSSRAYGGGVAQQCSVPRETSGVR